MSSRYNKGYNPTNTHCSVEDCRKRGCIGGLRSCHCYSLGLAFQSSPGVAVNGGLRKENQAIVLFIPLALSNSHGGMVFCPKGNDRVLLNGYSVEGNAHRGPVLRMMNTNACCCLVATLQGVRSGIGEAQTGESEPRGRIHIQHLYISLGGLEHWKSAGIVQVLREDVDVGAAECERAKYSDFANTPIDADAANGSLRLGLFRFQHAKRLSERARS
mmetsp:Transcript_49306/g.123597  ORF Transcript_49306/g.123597 Transcript_49306/m.123597 type:complete len:216 (-) Transcript_49306:166-813(-)